MSGDKITIDEMNEAIALFDGYEKYEDRFGIWFKRGELIKCLHPKLQDLKYHTSWDALMSIVKKIKDLIRDADCEKRIQMSQRLKPIQNETLNVDVENTHYCVYQFIQWLNQNKNQ